jgi:hypothetical protein
MTRQEQLLAREEIALLNAAHATCPIELALHRRLADHLSQRVVRPTRWSWLGR